MTTYPSGLRFESVVVPTPYAVGPANVYVITAEPVTLIDCGPNTGAAENALRLGMATFGMVPEQIGRIVITHGHPDHYGLASRLQEISGAEVLVGELDQGKLADMGTLALTGRLLLKTGIPSAALADMGERERAMGGNLHPAVANSVPVRGGESLVFDGFELELLHLPGHTGGHICPYDPREGVLFSGDTLLLEISPNPLMEPDPKDPEQRRRSLVEYLETLDRLAGMPLARVFPGHGPLIDDPHGLIEEMRRHHWDRVDHLATLLNAKGKSAWDLAMELFPNLEGFDNFLAVSEVLAHVDLLVLDGRAETVERDGVMYYRKAS
jgi:glyoxylase-like metal-dependent hydrolase (beta-lactamase superfamily II)